MSENKFAVPKNYGEAVEKAFNIELTSYEGMKMPYTIDETHVTINDKFKTGYSVDKETLSEERCLHKFTITYDIFGVQEQPIKHIEIHHGKALAPFDIARKLFYVVMSFYRPDRSKSARPRLSATQKMNREIGILQAKYLNKGKSYPEAEALAVVEWEKKNGGKHQQKKLHPNQHSHS